MSIMGTLDGSCHVARDLHLQPHTRTIPEHEGFAIELK
jgi:hypothetical protein